MDAVPYRPANTKPIKAGGRVIGYVDKKPNGPLGYVGAYRVKDDGNTDRIGATSSETRSIAMVREDYAERTEPQRPWCIRTRNGSTVVVTASTERQALMRAQTVLKRWAANALEPINAHVADPEFDHFDTNEPAINFGALKLPERR